MSLKNKVQKIKEKNYQNKKVGIIENGTWAPMAAKVMKDIILPMKNIDLCKNIVTIKSILIILNVTLLVTMSFLLITI